MLQTQLLIAVLIPTFTVLVGILLNKSDNNKLDTRLSGMESRLDARISGLESRLDARMNGLESRLDARMNGLEARFHADMLMLIGKTTEWDVRVSHLEEGKQKSA